MNHFKFLTACILFLILGTVPASALSISEFRHFSEEQQAIFISGAVSMIAYSYAASGDPARARCVMDWYFGKPGEDSHGPHQLAVEIEIVERKSAENYQIEGIVLGVVERECDPN